MSDPLGLIGSSGAGGTRPIPPMGPAKPVSPGTEQGPNFRDVLVDNLSKVNEAQQEADRAVEDLMTGRRSDVEGVILATQKADTAFQMLQAMRGKVLQAYDEVRQIRV